MYKCPITGCGQQLQQLMVPNNHNNIFKCKKGHVFQLKFGNIFDKERPCKLVCYCPENMFGQEFPVPCPPINGLPLKK